MIKRFQVFLGPTASRILILWLGITGLASLMLNAVVNQYDWVRPVQTLLVFVFLLGAALIIGSRLPTEERKRWAAVLIPAILALFIGFVIVPHLSAVFIGVALGWVVAGTLLTRARAPLEYRQAVRHLHKNRYAEAVQVLDELIRSEPEQANHYRFRAEVLRVWGKLDRAVRDYKHMTRLAPDSAVAFNGLSEVYFQTGQYTFAHEAARKANQLSPADWVTYYNLGMIEDRLKQADAVVEHLQKALSLKVKDARHRALIHFYLVRAFMRLGDSEGAGRELQALKTASAGLDEWQTLLDSDQAETLRAVLGEDVWMAQALASGDIELSALAGKQP